MLAWLSARIVSTSRSGRSDSILLGVPEDRADPGRSCSVECCADLEPRCTRRAGGGWTIALNLACASRSRLSKRRASSTSLMTSSAPLRFIGYRARWRLRRGTLRQRHLSFVKMASRSSGRFYRWQKQRPSSARALCDASSAPRSMISSFRSYRPVKRKTGAGRRHSKLILGPGINVDNGLYVHALERIQLLLTGAALCSRSHRTA